MKKAILSLLFASGAFLFIQNKWFSKTDNVKSFSELDESIQGVFALTHEELYEEELQKLAFRLQQEPFLQLNQRYSRKILIAANVKNEKVETSKAEQTVIETNFESTVPLAYTIQRLERSSGTFQQGKIYATVNSSDKTALRKLCRELKEQYAEFSSLVICLYSANETGIALAKGENLQFSEQDILKSWFIFFSYHPVEGDYIDDEPGKYLGS